MAQKDSDWEILSEDEKRLIAFFRSQPLRIKEILMNIAIFEDDCQPDESWKKGTKG